MTMGTLVIVYLALLSIFYVSAADVMIDDSEITLKSRRLGTISYGILDVEGSILGECLLERVNEKMYQLYPGSNVTDPNIHFAQLEGLKCGFKIIDINVGHVGKWKLKAFYLSQNTIEFSSLESKPINIIIEEEVQMIPRGSVTVYQGETLYISFAETPTNIQECEVWTGSGENDQTKATPSTNCSVTLRDVQPDVNGLWTFKAYGDIILYGVLNISVKDIPRLNSTTVDLRLGSSAFLKFGPKDAIYCEASDPTGLVHAMQNGQCSFKLPMATSTHHGEWKVQAALPGKTVSDTYSYNVNVEERDQDQINPDTVVSIVQVSDNKKTLLIKCSLMVPYINGCRMVRLDGKVFSFTEGTQTILAGGLYTYGKEKYEDILGNTINECVMEVQRAEIVDLLSWQCIMSLGDDNTEVGTYIDILERDDPLLAGTSNTTDIDMGIHDNVMEMQGKSFEIKCSLPRKLDYCWFLTSNNKQLVPIPGASNPAYEYVGRGLSLGECGIRIKNATFADTGMWSCNMGSYTDRDMKKMTHVSIYKSGVSKFFEFEPPNSAIIGCSTLQGSALDYCRFVRPDGQGINPVYANSSSYVGYQTHLFWGSCWLQIRDLTYEDFGTWTCAGKPTNSAEEYQETIHIYRTKIFGSRGWPGFTWLLYFIFTAGWAILFVALVQRTKMGARLKQRVRSRRRSYRDRNENKSPKQIEAESQI